MPKPRIILGAMSGTSADGVDIAVTALSAKAPRRRARLLHLETLRFPADLRRRVLAIRSAGAGELAELAAIGRAVTLAYAKAARRAMAHAGLSAAEVACVAAHGQTLFHDPPLTIQWFDPSLCAAETGCPVISDFRRADCALGGQGAPLVPYADWIMFGSPTVGRVLLNVGGIANITYLPAGTGLDGIIAFDTGPGNCLSDAAAAQRLRRAYDAGGRTAAKGCPDERVVQRFLKAAYFAKRWPKSTDGPAMQALFGDHPEMRTEDLLATACLCCARAVAEAIRRLPGRVDEIIAAGGGLRNRAIAQMLAAETQLPIRTTADFGVPIEAREAMAFALLADATLDGRPSNVPSVTGARRPVVLGSVTPVP